MKHLQSPLRYLTLLWMALMLTACAGFQADTFNKRMASAYVTVQVVNETASAALTAGKLTKDDATNVVTTSRAALAALDVAGKLHAASPGAGEDKLQATLTVLAALQAYLATKGAK